MHRPNSLFGPFPQPARAVSSRGALKRFSLSQGIALRVISSTHNSPGLLMSRLSFR